jgi:hypothetical protein
MTDALHKHHRRDLRPEEKLPRRDQFRVVILDDVGWVQQEREEMEVPGFFAKESNADGARVRIFLT